MSVNYIYKKIYNDIKKNNTQGYGGIDFSLDEYNLTNKQEDLLFELIINIDYNRIKNINIRYYGREELLPGNCKLFHNINNAYIGKNLSISWTMNNNYLFADISRRCKFDQKLVGCKGTDFYLGKYNLTQDEINKLRENITNYFSLDYPTIKTLYDETDKYLCIEW